MLNRIVKVVKKGAYLYGVCKEHPKASKFGYVLLHRLVMENTLGRYLTDEELVHHKDENKKNCAPGNLEVMSSVEHIRHHHQIGRTMIELVCKQCGVKFVREKRNTTHGKGATCSRRCNGLRARAIQLSMEEV